jgi:hypothetical protein
VAGEQAAKADKAAKVEGGRAAKAKAVEAAADAREAEEPQEARRRLDDHSEAQTESPTAYPTESPTASPTEGDGEGEGEGEGDANAAAVNATAAPVVRRASSTAYWRFEDSLPGAYYRRESVYADSSGNGNHLDYDEGTGSQVAYDMTVDGLPRNADCGSSVGLGCTYLEHDGGYTTDKTQRDDWVAYNGTYRSSNHTPPLSLFNVPAAPRAFTVSKRTSLYEV